eukprot:CAMPEP_0185900600 /NCGR_PEP_ID=MMETSP0196C-20130402/114_1 /TAXON_ID=2932 /ORGANISM="Alexandrium fundyense, Strain CCMP1719" /LENGTH=52 /DNA_ID=CAMNT_0028619081 /DNA_START=112 /DNA_END=266 /DNA_ORIENTATION=+
MGLKYASAYLLSVLGGKDSPTAGDIQAILESVGADFDASVASKLVSEMEGKA